MMPPEFMRRTKLPPDVAGNTPWERFDNAVRNVFNVSKEALVKEEAKLKRQKAKKRPKKRLSKIG